MFPSILYFLLVSRLVKQAVDLKSVAKRCLIEGFFSVLHL